MKLLIQRQRLGEERSSVADLAKYGEVKTIKFDREIEDTGLAQAIDVAEKCGA